MIPCLGMVLQYLSENKGMDLRIQVWHNLGNYFVGVMRLTGCTIWSSFCVYLGIFTRKNFGNLTTYTCMHKRRNLPQGKNTNKQKFDFKF